MSAHNLTSMQHLRDRRRPQGEPVFGAPWQAKAFALVVELHKSGLFAWNEWTQLLSENIREFEGNEEMVNNHDYYIIWLNTLEDMLEKKNFLHVNADSHSSPATPGNPLCLHTSSPK